MTFGRSRRKTTNQWKRGAVALIGHDASVAAKAMGIALYDLDAGGS